MMVKIPLLKTVKVQTDENGKGDYVNLNDVYAVIKSNISRTYMAF